MFYWIWETCYRADFELIVGSVGNSILCWTWYLASFCRGEWRQIMNVNLFDWVDLKESLGGMPKGTLSHMSSKSHAELNASVIHSLWLPRQEITIFFLLKPPGFAVRRLLSVDCSFCNWCLLVWILWKLPESLSAVYFLWVLLETSGFGAQPQRKLMEGHTRRPLHSMHWKW